MRKFLFSLFLCCYMTSPLANQGEDFLAMREAFRAGDAARVAFYAKRLQNYVLAPYVEYYQLRLYLETTDVGTIRAFLARYDDSLVADRLRADWLRILGRRQQWSLFAEEYPKLVNQDEGLTCYSLQYRLAAKERAAFEEAKSLWFTERDMPDSCTPVFNQLLTSGQLSVEDVWTRIRLALEAGNTGVARHVSRYLPANQTLNVQKLNEAAKDPQRYLERNPHD